MQEDGTLSTRILKQRRKGNCKRGKKHAKCRYTPIKV